MRHAVHWAGVLLGLWIAGSAPGRTWTSSDGKTLEADFVKLDGGQVHLRRPDGMVVVVPMSRLSTADQAVARAHPAPGVPVRAALPSKDPAKDAKAYAAAVARLNDAHVKKPGTTTEEDLGRQLPASAMEALQSVLAAPDDAPGLVPALVTLGKAALDLARAEDFAGVRDRLEALDREQAVRLGTLVVRPRFVVRAVGDLAPDYAENFARLMDAVLAAYDEVFGFAEYSKIPGKKLRIRVHRVSEIRKPPHFAPEFPWHSEVDFPVTERDAFRSPTPNGQFLLYGLCHELGHVVAMWGDAGTMEDHHAWAHYTGVVVVEQLQKVPPGNAFLESARDLRWRSLSVERKLPENQGTPSLIDRDGVMALLLALHDTAGPKAIGAALNWLDAEGKSPRINHVRYYRLDDLKRSLAATLADASARQATLQLLEAAAKP